VLALLCWRLPEPPRRGNDVASARGWRAAREDTRALLRVRTLRALMIGTAIGTGALTGIGFWAPTFYERHTTLTSSQASGVVGGLILVGALLGTLLGALIFGTLSNGMNLLDVSSNWQLILTGMILLGASTLDSWSSRHEVA